MMSTMNVLRRDPENKSVSMVTLPKPMIPDDDNVIIQVAYGGICGTDMHIMSGELDLKTDLILGHEIVGSIIATGQKVKSFSSGQHVAINTQRVCGKCSFCICGEVRNCSNGALKSAIGFNQDGGWREFWELPVHQVAALPGNLSLNTSVLLEPFGCVHHGWERAGKVSQGARILIMGAGVIGLLNICLLHHQGYDNVTITETEPERQKLATNLDLGYRVCHPRNLTKEFDTSDAEYNGFDVIVDCTGNIQAIEQAFGWLRRGATFNLFGLPATGARLFVDPGKVILRSITINGIIPHPHSLPKAVPLLNALATRGYLDFEKLGISVFSFKDYINAIQQLKEGKITKAVLKINEGLTNE